MKTRFYYKLDELFTDLVENPKSPFYAKTKNIGLEQILDMIAGRTATYATEDIGNTFTQLHFYPEFHNMPVLYVDVEHSPYEIPEKPELTDERVVEAKENLAARMLSTWYETYDIYFKLISMYKANEDDLLNKIESTSQTRFNDTPQNPLVGETDDYNSSITTVSSTQDPGELIDRLDNIRQKLYGFYSMWVREFNKFRVWEF